MKTTLIAIAMALLFASCSTSPAPARNVSGKRHPNLAAAQELIYRAFEKISDAQNANEFDMEGHAKKAKALLDQASDEIKLAAQAANK